MVTKFRLLFSFGGLDLWVELTTGISQKEPGLGCLLHHEQEIKLVVNPTQLKLSWYLWD
jgi:hypothetical protein